MKVLIPLLFMVNIAFAQKEIFEQMKNDAEKCKTLDCCQKIRASAQKNYPKNIDLINFIDKEYGRVEREIAEKEVNKVKTDPTSKIKQKKADKAKTDPTSKIKQKKADKAKTDPTSKIEQKKPNKVEDDPTAKIEQKKPNKAEDDPTSKIEQEKPNKAEDDHTAKIEQEKADKADADRIAKIEQEKADKAEADRIAKIVQEKVDKAKADRTAKIEQEKATFIAQNSNYNKQLRIRKTKIIITSTLALGTGIYAYSLNNQWKNQISALENVTIDPDNDGKIIGQATYNTYKTAYDAAKAVQKKHGLFIGCMSTAIVAGVYDAYLLLRKPTKPKSLSIRPATTGYGVALNLKF